MRKSSAFYVRSTRFWVWIQYNNYSVQNSEDFDTCCIWFSFIIYRSWSFFKLIPSQELKRAFMWVNLWVFRFFNGLNNTFLVTVICNDACMLSVVNKFNYSWLLKSHGQDCKWHGQEIFLVKNFWFIRFLMNL